LSGVLLHHALAHQLDLRGVRVEARAVRQPPAGAVHLVGDARAAAALARNADGDGAGVARAALLPREVALERRDLLADLALLHLRAPCALDRLAAAFLDQLNDRAERPGVRHRRGLLAGSAQARQERGHHLGGLHLAVELGLAVLQRLDSFLEPRDA